MPSRDLPPNFLTLDEVADELATSQSQVYALVRRGDLRAIKVGNRGAWRVRRPGLEDYIARLYEETDAFVTSTPFVESKLSDQRRG